MILKGCNHCGTVVQGRADDGAGNGTCRDCGGPLRNVNALEARMLARERRIAEQFRRVTQLERTVEAGRAMRPR